MVDPGGGGGGCPPPTPILHFSPQYFYPRHLYVGLPPHHMKILDPPLNTQSGCVDWQTEHKISLHTFIPTYCYRHQQIDMIW